MAKLFLGDAGCLSNGGISLGGRDVAAANNSLIASFFWLYNEEVPIVVCHHPPLDNPSIRACGLDVFLESDTRGCLIRSVGFLGDFYMD